ncbi:hypothetical protein M5K25_000512 [Dendrobium thyrsiflorum]|uniref:Uncharacterized protein n=1 Tax=Dendrobium thyrsiflorum TaxID=117978 RepID=A0ABD0VVW2_DENTH
MNIFSNEAYMFLSSLFTSSESNTYRDFIKLNVELVHELQMRLFVNINEPNTLVFKLVYLRIDACDFVPLNIDHRHQRTRASTESTIVNCRCVKIKLIVSSLSPYQGIFDSAQSFDSSLISSLDRPFFAKSALLFSLLSDLLCDGICISDCLWDLLFKFTIDLHQSSR